MDALWQDLRYALRTLSRSPGFTLIAVLTLALGIGANSAIFTVVQGVLLKPLEYRDPERIVIVLERNLDAGFPRFSFSPPNFRDLRDLNHSFEYVAARTSSSFNLTGEGVPERLPGNEVSADYFRVLAVEPAAGRLITAEDDQAGAEPVVVLSYRLWQNRFGGDTGLIGRPIQLNGKPYTVIGVLPASFPQRNWDVFTPMAGAYESAGRGGHFFSVYARLKPDVTLEQAREDVTRLAAQLEQTYPDTNTGWSAIVLPLQELMVEDVKTALLALLGAVGLVLLIACANVANLMLSRIALRDREVALRTALGATRRRLLRQLLTESMLLALAGGGLGLLLAVWGTRTLMALNADSIPRAEEVVVDGGVLAFTLAVALATGILFGLLPALQGSRVDLNGALKEGGRGQSGGLRSRRTRRLLVVAEVAVALTLLIGAGLMIRSLGKLLAVDPGFDPKNALTAQITLPNSRYGEGEQRIELFRQLYQRAAALPGVTGVGSIMPMPLTGDNFVLRFFIQGRPLPQPNQGPQANIRVVSPEFFHVFGIPLYQGRDFTFDDNRNAPPVAVINRSTAERYWPDQDPLGQRIVFGDPEDPEAKWMTIVGIVGDVHHSSLEGALEPEIYWPHLQRPFEDTTLVLRTAGADPTTLAGPLRAELDQLDPDLPLYSIRPLEQIVTDSVAQPRFNATLLTLFAGLALVLAAIGVYGLISYAIAQRLHELGIRVALGAGRGHVLATVVREGMTPVLWGLGVGLVAAFLATRLLSSLIFGVSATDPATFVLLTGLFAAIALAACLLPALRATRVDPVVVLREE